MRRWGILVCLGLTAWPGRAPADATVVTGRIWQRLELVEQEAVFDVDGEELERSSPQRALSWLEEWELTWVVPSAPRQSWRPRRLRGLDSRRARLGGGEKERSTRYRSALEGGRLRPSTGDGPPDSGANAGGVPQLPRALKLAGPDPARWRRLAVDLEVGEERDVPLDLLAELLWPPAIDWREEGAEGPDQALISRLQSCRRELRGRARLRRRAPNETAEGGDSTLVLSATLDTYWGSQRQLETHSGGVGDASRTYELALDLEGRLVLGAPPRLRIELEGRLRLDREEVRSLQSEVSEFESTRLHRFAGRGRYWWTVEARPVDGAAEEE